MTKILPISLALVFMFCGLGIAADKVPDGKTLLENRCSVCHSSEWPKMQKETPAQWDATVSNMMMRGARLSPEEKDVLVKYLSAHYKP